MINKASPSLKTTVLFGKLSEKLGGCHFSCLNETHFYVLNVTFNRHLMHSLPTMAF